MLYNTLFSNLAKHVILTAEEQHIVASYVKPIQVHKGVHLLREGAYCKHIYFVVKGCLRLYAYDGNNEATVLFAPENWWMNEIDSFSSNKPSKFAIEALEDTEILAFEAKDYELLLNKIPKLARFFRLLFQNAFGLFQRRMHLILSQDASKRYAWFGKQYPKLELRIPQKYIASYLGITTVFLSNIRRKNGG
ncbi:Crp/Fnr family transcriptional regulator [Sphingobacterium siyangense]|uniref:Crp/Fnr family transcriptional regulator n=1 Tax=Sphingobacterium TaxID=28453 RepID=UPI00095889A2|nr:MULTISPECIES: Crp/Fnr family transcriptional regulator [Sphingobacterium]APU97942.1 hypothetical protein BV902_17695 [Sphingobacterium sp. B29]UQA73368.1 Crp/Fnr family transcriptional regulator [Sphingobacterium siyangense]